MACTDFQDRSPLRCPRRLPLLAASLLGAALLAGCNDSSTKTATPPAAAQPAVPVGVVRVENRPVTTGLDFVGRVDAINNVSIIARVSGFLNERRYTEGQEVKAGDLLFVLQKDSYQAQVDAAQANLAKAQAEADNAKTQADRARQLVRDQTISQAVYDDRMAQEKITAAAILQAKAALEEAQINLGYTDIRAPFDGRVGISNFSVGALVNPTSGPLATIVSQDPVYVTFQVSDRTALQFQEAAGKNGGAQLGDIVVRLKLSTGAEYPHLGTINFTGVQVDPNTDTLTVRARFPNPERLLVAGQYARVTAQLKEPVAALVIPQRAVMTDQSGNFVMVAGADNKAMPVHVTLGATQGADVVVEQGLKEGDMIIVDGLQRIRPGQVVAPQPAAAAQAPGQLQGAKSAGQAPQPAGQPSKSAGN